MSEFTSKGGDVFPNTYSDAQEIIRVADWTDEHLDFKLNEYGAFMQREDLMARARKTGDFILERLIFEQAFRDGVFSDILMSEEVA